jgi:hypothetical protein
MIHNKKELNRWKIDQLNYFKKYLVTFQVDTREYDLIKTGIEQLERSL